MPTNRVRLALVTAAVICACDTSLGIAQTRHSASGTWQVTLGELPWSLVLEATGSDLKGVVSSCGSNPGAILPAQITDGHLNGNAISFTCGNMDRTETLKFTGTVNADEMTLAFESTNRGGSPSLERPPDRTGMFGASSPTRVVARKVLSGGKEYGGAVNLRAQGLKVEGALYLPRTVARIRAVLVLINSGTSWGGLAASVYPDAEVRTLAATAEAGLLLLRVTPLDTGGFMYFVTNATAGADEGLIQLLDRLAADAGHPELRNAPVLFWGHSAAGPFGTTFALRHPGRTIGYVRYHSGVGGIPRDLGVLQRIPGLFLQAAADVKNNLSAFNQLEAEWKRGRVAGAPWTFGIEPDAVHQNPADVKKANAVLVPWIAAVLRMRLRSDGQGLKDVVADSGPESWFPDDLTRRGWNEVTRPSPEALRPPN